MSSRLSGATGPVLGSEKRTDDIFARSLTKIDWQRGAKVEDRAEGTRPQLGQHGQSASRRSRQAFCSHGQLAGTDEHQMC